MHPYVRLLCGCRILSYLYQLCSLQALPGVAVLQAAPEASEMAVVSKAFSSALELVFGEGSLHKGFPIVSDCLEQGSLQPT